MTSPVKVAVIYSGARFFGGVETYLSNLAESLDGERVDLRLYSLGEWELCERFRAAGLSTTVFAGSRIRWATIGDLHRTLVADHIDVVVTQGTISNFYGRLAARRAGLPVVTFVHSELAADYPNVLLRTAHDAADRVTASAVSSYVAVSPYLGTYLERRGIARAHVQVIPTGITTAASEPPEVCGPSTDGEVVIVSVGRLQPVKNYPALIRALATLSSHPWRLRIFGEGPERDAILGTAAQSGVADRVELAGWEPDLSVIMGGANLYVQPSLSEGFGLAVVEAMAAGVPVVVTPAGNLAHLVEDGVTGVIATGTDEKSLALALDRALSDAELRHCCALAGQRCATTEYGRDRWAHAVAEALIDAAR